MLPLAVSTGRLHAHTVATPGAVTQELNRCLTIVRVAATRRSASSQRVAKGRAMPPQSPERKRPAAYDDYKIPAGTSVTIRVRTGVDSASGQADDPVRATLAESVTQDGVELVPAGSSLHGRITEVAAASRNNPLGRVVLEFHVIEHLETHSLATIAARPVAFDAAARRGVKLSDVQVRAGENVVLTLTRPLVVHMPRK
jgi:hypothetical protein